MELADLPEGKKIILFDGFCNLCDSSIHYVIKKDTNDVFRFVQLQSDLGKKILQHIGIANQNIDSLILYQPGIAYYYKSSAVIEISKTVQGFFNYGMFFQVLPSFLRDRVYDYVAKNRYKWYGKKETCMLPTSELKAKFL